MLRSVLRIDRESTVSAADVRSVSESKLASLSH